MSKICFIVLSSLAHLALIEATSTTTRCEFSDSVCQLSRRLCALDSNRVRYAALKRVFRHELSDKIGAIMTADGTCSVRGLTNAFLEKAAYCAHATGLTRPEKISCTAPAALWEEMTSFPAIPFHQKLYDCLHSSTPACSFPLSISAPLRDIIEEARADLAKEKKEAE